MKKYPTMKPSGVEWMGDVPEHWEVSRFKYFYRSGMGETILKEDLEEEGCLPVFSATENDQIFGFVNSAKLILEKGDFVIPARGNSIGHIMEVEQKCTSTQTTIYSKKSSQVVQTRFTFHFLKGLKPHLFQFDRTAIPQITVQQVGNNPFLLPPTAEQLAIAHYLDRKTAQLDQAIAEKERLIELFREERQAIINHAVTKGIRAGVKMKASGGEWIGEMPENWEVKKLKYFCKVISKGTTPSTEGQDFTQKGIRFLKAENIAEGGVLPFPEFFINEETNAILQRSQLQENDLLIVIAGATIGKIGIVTVDILPANTNQAVCFLRLREKELVGFLHLVLQADYIQRLVKFDAVQSAQPNLAMGVLGNFRIATPPSKEIGEIVDYVKKKTTQITTAISGIQQEIALLQEYRQALIFEAVTGKVCVV